MPVTVKDLKQLPDEKTLLVAAGGSLHPVDRIVTNDALPYVIVAVKEPSRKSQRLTPNEEKFLIGAVSYGIPVQVISDLLSRDVESIRRYMKKISLSYLDESKNA